ncbi:ABC transporter ATP-binding protein [Egicoccus halophilus]|uniref:ABC transporter ATP-binding protein n=1 Tax=Egicoccus halophilus TaxID=1670830 RepID=A0A8J3A733_9ACTN|nr:ABC transporter ATP-binding protein [Egicoccus halophilus]GGI05276.1 ABC transporter ATP-binding protein [Egicoccus halophilus]
MLETARSCLRLIDPRHRTRWFGLAGLAVVSSGLEILGALMVYSMLSLVAAEGLDLPLPVAIVDRLGDPDDNRVLVTVALAMAVFFVLRAAFQALVGYLHARLAATTGANLAKRLTAGYLALPYAFHLRRNSSTSIRNVQAATAQVVNGGLAPLINVFAATVVTAGLLVVMVVISPLGTALAVVVVGSAMLVLLRLIQPRLKWYGQTAHQMSQQMLQAIQQALQGLRDIKLLGREKPFTARFGEGVDEFSRMAYLRATLGQLPRLVMETALLVFILLFFAVSAALGQASGQVVSVLGMFAYVGLRVQPSLTAVVSGLNELRYASAAVDDVLADLELVASVELPDTAASPRPLRSNIELRRVSFRYDGAAEDALRDVDLVLDAGTMVGICGATGSGKSTLMDVITGLLPPTDGQVLVDGVPLEDDRRGWQRNLGVVSQSVFLVDDTIRRNIALGVPDDELDEEQLHEAVQLAQLEDVLAALPDGLETTVGEGGVRLSGGQRQRVAIARALYRQADVLLLDEGTSALDNLTEARLMQALHAVRAGRTVLVVAHRLSTVEACDRVLLVEGGRVRADGGYDELLERDAAFRRLALRQELTTPSAEPG